MKKFSLANLIWIAFYVFLFLILLKNSFNYLDPDFGWHLEVGRQALIDLDVARADLYDFPLQGVNWVDHEWLTNIIVYLIYNYLGYFVLNIIFALIIVAAFFIFNRYLKTYIFDANLPLLLIPLEILGLYGMAPLFGIRMQELGVLFLVLTLFLLAKYDRSRNNRLLFIFPIFFYAWSNLHGSFLVGLASCWLWFFYQLLGGFFERLKLFEVFVFPPRLDRNRKKLFFASLMIATLSTFFTPYGLGYYSFIMTYASTYYLTHISEWFPTWSFPIMHYQMVYLALAAAFLFLPFFNKEKKKHDIWQWALALSFFIMAMRARRNFPLFFIASFPVIAGYLFKETGASFLKNLKIGWLYILFPALALAAASGYIVNATNFTNQPFQNERFCQVYPCEMLDWLEKNEQYSDLRLFNEYIWGGWLMFNRPGKQIFIDGRIPQYAYNDRSFLEEYFDFFDEKLVGDKLEEHGIEMVMYRKKKPVRVGFIDRFFFGYDEADINDRIDISYIEEFLKSAPDWKLVYEDKVGFVYIKNSSLTTPTE